MNKTSGPTQSRSRDRLSELYITGASALGVAVVAWALVATPPVLAPAGLFVALAVLAELASRGALASGPSFAVTSVVALAALLTLGPWPAVLVSAAGGSIASVEAILGKRSRPAALRWPSAVFPPAVRGLSAAAAGGAYVLAGGVVGAAALPAGLPAMVVAAAVLELTPVLLLAVRVSLEERMPLQVVWMRSLTWAVGLSLPATLIAGWALALAYEVAGAPGALAVMIPVALALYGRRLQAAPLRRRVASLERIIVELERSERQLTATLHEKELLLREVHHRAKNNLQIMSSLLYLQSRRTEDARTQAILKECESRVRSMALVHDRLGVSTNRSTIDFGEYVHSLATHLLRSYGADPDLVHLHVSAETVFVSAETAVPGGLVLHELVSNSLKHAFPGGRAGSIRIELRRRQDGRIELTVGDDGIGLDSARDPQNAEHLGLSLVHTLVDQLEGTLVTEAGPGTIYRVVLTDAKKLRREAA